MRSKPAFFALLFAFAFQEISAQDKSVELGQLLDRASQYAAEYEDQRLGNLLVNEDYRQKATFFNPGGVQVSGNIQRRIESDFLILQVGMDRVGVRKVNRVDGLRVESREASLEDLMNDSPEGIKKRRAALREENTRYDVGEVLRENNVPTYALQVARKSEAPRFKFEKAGTEKINGVQTAKVKFKETAAPTLLVGKGREPLYSSGMLWIEPNTGTILKTEFEMDNPYPKQKARGKSVVTYSESKELGIYVPTLMIEHYETAESYVDTRADYSRFRVFKVDVKSDIGR